MGVVHQSSNSAKFQEVADNYPEEFCGVTARDWLASPNNIGLNDDDGNWGLFHRQVDGIYTGHYFFKSKGRAAITASKHFLDYFFDLTGEKILRGLTPVNNKAAIWMSRQVGFKSLGQVDSDHGPCELFVMIKD